MKKLFTLIFVSLFLISLTSFASAFEFDNSLNYKDNDMTAVVTNAFGLGEELGEATLKSHSSPTEIKNVMPGRDRLVMYYDFKNFKEGQTLGEVIFTDMRTGKEIEKDYYFAYAVYDEVKRPVYKNYCLNVSTNSTNSSFIEKCERKIVNFTYTNEIVDWKKLNTRNLSKGNITIALVTDVERGDYYDGIWTIAGKKIKKHAEWTDALREGLISYYKLDETSGTTVTDAYGSNNGTNNGATVNVAGKINASYDFNGLGNNVDFPNVMTTSTATTMSFWIKSDTDETGDTQYLLDDTDGTNRYYVYSPSIDNSFEIGGNGVKLFDFGSTTTAKIFSQAWTHVVIIWQSGASKLYINGIQEGSDSTTTFTKAATDLRMGSRYLAEEGFDGSIDEVGIWNRTLTADEITQLYNSGNGITYTEILQITTTHSFPANNSKYSTSPTTIDLGCNFTSKNQNITSIKVNVYNSSNYLSFTETNSTNDVSVNKTWTTSSLGDGDYNWECFGYGSAGINGSSGNWTFSIDSTPPTINSIYPNTTFDYHILGNNLTYNYSVTDTYFDKAVFSYNGVNYTFTGTTNSSTFPVVLGLNNGTWYFNDSSGNLKTEVMRWNYKIFQNNITYNSEAIELSQETFILNFTYTPSLWTSISGNLNYDDTNYSSTLSGSGGTKLLTNTLSIPSINSEQNKTFYWVIRLTNSSGEFFINTDEYNQTITDIGIDNCSSYSTRLYNLTLEDEEEQTSIRGDIEIELEITGIETITDTINFSTSFTNVSNSGVCLNTNLTNQGLYLDTTIKYKSNGFQTEYYNIQNYVLNTSSKTQEITLYDLNSTSATIFDITYKGSDFIAVSDAIIIITKKFVSEGLFKTVEIPLTDIDGKTTASLEKDSEIYTFNIYKDGEFLSTFQNVIPTCQNDLTDDCEINLNEVSSPDSIDDFTNLDNLNYQVTWDEDTSTIDLTYSTATGESSEINLLVTQFDQYENDTICDNSVTASSGSLSCVVPSSYTNQTVIIQLYTDEEFVSRYSISLQQSPVDYFGYTGLFLALLIIITIPFMFITSLIGVIIGIIIGMVMLSLLLLSSGANIYSITGGIVWFFIAAAILIWKLNENDRR